MVLCEFGGYLVDDFVEVWFLLGEVDEEKGVFDVGV